MPWKKEKKSRSVNDIPVEKNHNNIIHSLDDGDFLDLLSSVSQPSYNQRSSGFLTFQGARDAPNSNKISVRETSALVKVCEKGLRDEDAAKEEEKRRQHQKRASTRSGCSSSSFDRPHRPGSYSPSVSPPSRRLVPPPPAPFGNKSVDFDEMNMDYIDETGDVEMEDLSGVPNSSNVKRYTKGNREDMVRELNEGGDDHDSYDVEYAGGRYGVYRYSDPINSYQWPTDPDEKELLHAGKILSRDQTVLPPQNDGMFSSLSYDMAGNDEVPKLTPSGMPLPLTAELVRLGSDSASGHIKYDDKSQEALAANAKLEGKRKKKKKDKESNTFPAENVPGYMGCLPLDQLLNLIEGEPTGSEQNSGKKQKGYQQQPSSIASQDPATSTTDPSGETSSARKEARRRKSKEGASSGRKSVSKESSSSSSPPPGGPATTASASHSQPAATIGAQQAKAAAAAAAAPATPSKTSALDIEVSKEALKSKPSGPVKSSPKASGASRASARGSTEEGEEEFLSADEGIPLSNATSGTTTSINKKQTKVPVGRSSTSVASTASFTSSAAISSEVMLDGANYRADDEDVTVIERHAVEEPEFITVSGGKTKKKHSSTSTASHQTTTRTGSAGKIERRQRIGGGSTSSASGAGADRRSSLEERVSSSLPFTQQQKPSPRRPGNSQLGDFIEDRKIDGAGIKQTPVKGTRVSASGGGTPQSHKKAARQSTADSDYQDAEEMTTVMQTRGSPERVFSYADAAKKSSDQQSRDQSPSGSAQNLVSPNPTSLDLKPSSATAAPNSPSLAVSAVTTIPSSSPSAAKTGKQGTAGAAELPPMPAGESGVAATGGLSFFYDENEANRSDETIEGDTATEVDTGNDGAFVLNLGGKTVRFAKGMAASAEPVDGRIRQMTETMQLRWAEFNKGAAPVYYQAAKHA